LNNFILSGAAHVGLGRVRSVTPTSDVAKFGSNLYGLSGVVAYDFHQGSHLITPSLSLQYSYFTQNSYNQSGVNGGYVSAKNAQVLTPILAVKYSYNINVCDLKVQPGLQLSVAQDIVNKTSGIANEFQWQENQAVPKSSRKNRATMYLNPTLTIKGSGHENTLSYTLTRSAKVVGHTFSLKTALSF
jgi:outer membrane autotransporter protein